MGSYRECQGPTEFLSLQVPDPTGKEDIKGRIPVKHAIANCSQAISFMLP